MKNTFYISCPIDTYSGYGARSRDFVKSLIELDKYEVKIISQRWGNTPWGFIEDHKEEWGFLQSHLVSLPLHEKPDVWCQITVANEFQPIGTYNIGLTAGIETTVCAPQWIEGCNRMDLILVSSNHSKQVFEKTSYSFKDKPGILKIEKPIEVLFEGVDLKIYKPLKKQEIENQQLYNQINSIPESFAFLFVGHWLPGELGEDRKNVGLLIKAFYEIFKNKKNPPALILKTASSSSSYMDRREIHRRINMLRKSINSTNLPNVYLLHGDLKDKEINELYNHPKVKSMVNLTKGEGFGRPLLEFTTSKKPIIASGWSGHVDFLKPEMSCLLGGKLTPIHKSAQVKDLLVNDSSWFSPDESQIGHYIKDVFENYKNWVGKGKQQGFYCKNNFSLDKMKELIDKILEERLPKFPKKVNLVLPDVTDIKLPSKNK